MYIQYCFTVFCQDLSYCILLYTIRFIPSCDDPHPCCSGFSGDGFCGPAGSSLLLPRGRHVECFKSRQPHLQLLIMLALLAEALRSQQVSRCNRKPFLRAEVSQSELAAAPLADRLSLLKIRQSFSEARELRLCCVSLHLRKPEPVSFSFFIGV